MLVVRSLPETGSIFGNTTCADFLGVPDDEIAGNYRLDFIPNTSDKEQIKARIAALTPEHQITSQGQHRLLSKNGETRWTQWTERALFEAGSDSD